MSDAVIIKNSNGSLSNKTLTVTLPNGRFAMDVMGGYVIHRPVDAPHVATVKVPSSDKSDVDLCKQYITDAKSAIPDDFLGVTIENDNHWKRYPNFTGNLNGEIEGAGIKNHCFVMKTASTIPANTRFTLSCDNIRNKNLICYADSESTVGGYVVRDLNAPPFKFTFISNNENINTMDTDYQASLTFYFTSARAYIADSIPLPNTFDLTNAHVYVYQRLFGNNRYFGNFGNLTLVRNVSSVTNSGVLTTCDLYRINDINRSITIQYDMRRYSHFGLGVNIYIYIKNKNITPSLYLDDPRVTKAVLGFGNGRVFCVDDWTDSYTPVNNQIPLILRNANPTFLTLGVLNSTNTQSEDFTLSTTLTPPTLSTNNEVNLKHGESELFDVIKNIDNFKVGMRQVTGNTWTKYPDFSRDTIEGTFTIGAHSSGSNAYIVINNPVKTLDNKPFNLVIDPHTNMKILAFAKRNEGTPYTPTLFLRNNTPEKAIVGFGDGNVYYYDGTSAKYPMTDSIPLVCKGVTDTLIVGYYHYITPIANDIPVNISIEEIVESTVLLKSNSKKIIGFSRFLSSGSIMAQHGTTTTRITSPVDILTGDKTEFLMFRLNDRNTDHGDISLTLDSPRVANVNTFETTTSYQTKDYVDSGKKVDYFTTSTVNFTDGTNVTVAEHSWLPLKAEANSEVLIVGVEEALTDNVSIDLDMSTITPATATVTPTLHLVGDPADKFIKEIDYSNGAFTLVRTDNTTTPLSAHNLSTTGLNLEVQGTAESLLAFGVYSGADTSSPKTYNISYDPIIDVPATQTWSHTLKVKGHDGKFVKKFIRENNLLYMVFSDDTKVQIPNISNVELELGAGSEYLVIGNEDSYYDTVGTEKIMNIDIGVPSTITKQTTLRKLNDTTKFVTSIVDGTTVHYSDGTTETPTFPFQVQCDPNTDASILGVGMDTTSTTTTIDLFVDSVTSVTYKRFNLGHLKDFNSNVAPYFNCKLHPITPNTPLTIFLFHKTIPTPEVANWTFNPIDYNTAPSVSLESGTTKYNATVKYIHSPSCIEYTLDHAPTQTEFDNFIVVVRIYITDINTINDNDLTVLIKSVKS